MDIIKLLPDSVANQIAAGEVIQRPASAVKELLENAIDAGATNIKLIIKDAGRTLVQVVDNGCGMSETDARLSFERHATSKIRQSDDLFSIRTMGFRGEALASIAAVAQVELKTRRTGDELGTIIETEASEVKKQESCHCPEGTSFSMKNLFHNVPARRNFLKTNAVELKHIIDEFERVALAYPHIALSMHNNGEAMYSLKGGNMAQRIVGIYGAAYQQRLVAINEQTSIIDVTGYVIKPEFSKKTRGEQFFFVNNRFIKDPYLHHAVQGAFEEMLPQGHYPSYFLAITIDPSKIDINIHPTKTEIKFEDEKSIYAIMRSAVKRSLGVNNIVPTIDFNQELAFNIPIRRKEEGAPEKPFITINTDYNPFTETVIKKSSASHSGSGFGRTSRNGQSTQREWAALYQGLEKENTGEPVSPEEVVEHEQELMPVEETIKPSFQLHNRYILSQIKSGVMLIDQQLAHERILYEKYLHDLTHHTVATQQQLFTQTIEFNAPDFALLKELEEDIRILGFDMHQFGKNTYVIQGLPADIVQGEARLIIEGLLEQYKHNVTDLRIDKRDNIARSMARNTAIKAGKVLSAQEMKAIINELFACQMPYTSPYGKPTVVVMTLEELAKKFV